MDTTRTPEPPTPPARRKLALAAVCLGQFMLQLDTTIVNVALPGIGRTLHTSTPSLQWVVDGYIVALASLLLTSGRIGDRSGHRRVYLVGIAIFALGSGLCAAAASTGELIAFRVLQGVGAALELPATLALLTGTFPDPRERGQAVGVWAGSGGLSLVLGPVLGGLLIRSFGWRAVFLVNLPIALLAAALVVVAVRETRDGRLGRLDLPGQVLGAGTLVLLAAAAIEGERRGFSADSLPSGLLVAGALALVAFLRVERRHVEPMLPLGYFGNRSYAAANLDGLVMGLVMFSVLFVFALYFQQVRGDSPLATGLRFVPLCGAFALAGPLVGRLVHRVGARLPMALGLGLVSLGAAMLLGVTGHTGYASVWPGFLILGTGYGMTSTPMAAAVLGAVPAERVGMASSTNNAARQVGGVFGIAILGSLLPARTTGPSGPFIGGLHTGLLIAAVLALGGAVLAASQIERGTGPRGRTSRL